jgi:hypothetical protein
MVRVVGKNHGHPLARFNTDRCQSIRQPVNADFQVPECNFVVAVDAEDILGRLPGTLIQQLGYDFGIRHWVKKVTLLELIGFIELIGLIKLIRQLNPSALPSRIACQLPSFMLCASFLNPYQPNQPINLFNLYLSVLRHVPAKIYPSLPEAPRWRMIRDDT